MPFNQCFLHDLGDTGLQQKSILKIYNSHEYENFLYYYNMNDTNNFLIVR